MAAALLLMAVLAAGAGVYLHQPLFGQTPEGEALGSILMSPNQVGGVFENQTPTPMFRDGESSASIVWKNMTSSPQRLAPEQPLPSVKLDLQALPIEQDTLVWLGHSSYYLHLAGQRILIDPVFSAYASPVFFANRAFDGSTPYSADDIPPVDLLLITHDHWDHLDHDTLTALRPRVRQVITGLGVGSHLVHWGYAPQSIREGDWMDHFDVGDRLTVHVLPARHYSGRGLQRNRSLWVGFALVSPDRRWFFSGDSGYGPHFRAIGEQFKGFDLVALDSGQYDERWPLIHMTPEEAAQAAEDLSAKALLPAHIGRFAMARHAWDEPLQRSVAASQGRDYRLLTPIIGDAVALAPTTPSPIPTPRQTETRMKIRIQFKTDTLTVVLDDSLPAREFAAMLPLTLKVGDFASAEKIAYLPNKLPVQGVPEGTDARAGDLAYYAPWGNLALFYKAAPYARGLVRLGHVTGDTEKLMHQPDSDILIERASD